MAFTQTHLDQLDAAIAAGRGARTITFGDQTITFHDIDQMLALRAQMQRELNVAAGTRRTHRVGAFDKGL